MSRTQLSRRDFLKAIGAAGVITIGAGWACAPQAATSPTAKEGAKQASGPAQPQGTLTAAVTNLAEEYWSPSSQPATSNWVSGVYEFLAYWDEKGSLNPGLAERWEMSPDGRNVTFYLRKGVQFHAGLGEFTAQDVKSTWEVASVKGTKNVQAANWASLVDKVDVVNPYQISFALKRPVVDFIYGWATPLPWFPIISKKYLESVGEDKAFRQPIGTGPFKFIEHKVGDYLKFEGLKEHWRQVPRFATVVIKAVPEEASRIAMLRAGEADIIEVSRPFKNEVLSAGLKIKSVPNAAIFGISFGGLQDPGSKNYDAATPWVGADPKSEKSLKVRKALNLAINRQPIVDGIFMGEANVATVPGFYPGTPQWDDSWKGYPYDPDQAKKLLAEAGYPNGFEVSMWTFSLAGRTEMPAMGQAVAMDWQKIGVKVNLVPTEYVTVGPKLAARELRSNPWPYGIPWETEPFIMLQKLGYSKTGTNLLGYAFSDLDNLIDQAATEPDAAKRASIQKKIGQLVYDNYLWAPIAVTNSVWAYGKRVNGWPQPRGSTYLTNLEYVAQAG